MADNDSLGELLVRSLGPRSRPDDSTDERIIDATVEELRHSGLRRLRVDDVADRARVSRITVYRRFGDRSGLIEATLTRETSRFLAAIADADDEGSPIVERVVAAFATGVLAARRHPLVAHWLMTDPGELVNELLADDAFVLRSGAAFIAHGLAELGLPDAPDRDAEQLSELLVRVVAAMVVMAPPSARMDDQQQVRELARQLVVPVLFERPAVS